MSLFNRRTILTGLALTPLAGCGFTPIYGEGSAAEKMHGRIALGALSGQDGFQMRERLETRLGRAVNPTHRLEVDFDVVSKGLAITTDGAITRYNLSGTANYVVYNLSDQIVFQNKVKAVTAYNATSSAYATRVAKQDAYQRVVVTLAEKIATELSITAKDWLL